MKSLISGQANTYPFFSLTKKRDSETHFDILNVRQLLSWMIWVYWMGFFKGFTATVILFIVERSLVYGNCSHCHSLCPYTAPPHPDIILPVHQRMPSTYPLVSVMLCSLAGICLSHCYLVPFLFHLCRHPVVCIIGWLNKNKKKYYQKKKKSIAAVKHTSYPVQPGLELGPSLWKNMGSPWKGFVEFTLPGSPPTAFVSADLSSPSPVGLSLSPYGRSVSSSHPPTPPLPSSTSFPIEHPSSHHFAPQTSRLWLAWPFHPLWAQRPASA